jgi:hypothetical protein
MSNPALLMDEDFVEDCRSSTWPDFPDMVKCEDATCGAVIAKDDAVRVGRDWFCASHFDGREQ